MAMNDRSPEQKAADRAKLAEMALFGSLTQRQMAKLMGLSPGTVCRDLKFVRDQWMADAKRDIGCLVAQEVKKLDRLEDLALESFKLSLGDRITSTDGQSGENPISTRVNMTQHGDPRFLNELRGIHADRCKLLGLHKPVKMEVEVTDRESVKALILEKLRSQGMVVPDIAE